MITRRQVLSLPVVPAAVAFVQQPATPDVVVSAPAQTPTAAVATPLPDDLVDDRGWIVSSADRDAIAARRRARASTPASTAPRPVRRPRRPRASPR